MKALSIKQPWAWLIASGFKPIENRNWRYQPRFRGPFLIHAGKQPAVLDARFIELCRGRRIKIPADLPLGGIVGSAEIVDVVTASRSPWCQATRRFTESGAILRRPDWTFACSAERGHSPVPAWIDSGRRAEVRSMMPHSGTGEAGAKRRGRHRARCHDGVAEKAAAQDRGGFSASSRSRRR